MNSQFLVLRKTFPVVAASCVAVTAFAMQPVFAEESPTLPAESVNADEISLPQIQVRYPDLNVEYNESNFDSNGYATATVAPEYYDVTTGKALNPADDDLAFTFYSAQETVNLFDTDALPYGAQIDPDTGVLTFVYNQAAKNHEFNFKVGVMYKNGPQAYVGSRITVNDPADAGKLSTQFNPEFEKTLIQAEAGPDGVTVAPVGLPSSGQVASLEVAEDLGDTWKAEVDSKTGQLTVKLINPWNPPIVNETFNVPVTLTYTDGSQDQLSVAVEWVNSDTYASNFQVDYEVPDGVQAGQENVARPAFRVYSEDSYQESDRPEGVTYELVGEEPEGISLSINQSTGDITYSIKDGSQDQEFMTQVLMTFPDNSIRLVDVYLYIFTEDQHHDEPTAEPTQTSAPLPSANPTETPTQEPTQVPSVSPTVEPTSVPSGLPTSEPSPTDSQEPSFAPSAITTDVASPDTTKAPTILPTAVPTSSATTSTANASLPESVTPAETHHAETTSNDPSQASATPSEPMNEEQKSGVSISGEMTSSNASAVDADGVQSSPQPQEQAALASTGARHAIGITATGILALTAGAGIVIFGSRKHLSK